MKVIIAILLLVVVGLEAVTVDDELSAELEEIIGQFQGNPTSRLFKQLINVGRNGIYSLMIWSPAEQYSVDVTCATHHTILVPTGLTNEFTQPNRKGNPR